MRILQVFNQYRFHGGEEVWVNAIPRLLENQAVVEEMRFQSTDWSGPDRPNPLEQIFLIGDNPESRAALRHHVERFRPDVLLFHNVIPVGSLGLYFEAKSLNIPVLQYTHNYRPFSPCGILWNGHKVIDAALHGNPWPEILSGAWQNSRLKTAVFAWHLQHAMRKGLLDCVDHWLAISEFMRDRFMEAGIPAEKITTLRHCSHTVFSIEEAPESDYYLFLGRTVSEKGVMTLVDAWQEMEDTLGNKCPKLIIAGDGPLDDELIRYSARMKTVDCVGYVDGERKSSLIRHCRALLVPSIWWEPLGLTTYEAYAASRPVIAARSGALQETVIEGKTGWLHEAGNAKDLARVLIDAEQVGPEKRSLLGTQGHEWLQEHANPEQWRNRFFQIASEIVSRKARE